MEEEEVIQHRLVAILDQCFSIASPNFKTTPLFSVLHHCYLVKGRIHMYCEYNARRLSEFSSFVPSP